MSRDDISNRVIEQAANYRRLWAAVLWLAVYDLSGNRRRTYSKAAERARELQIEAKDYLFSDSNEIGSASWICDHLNIDFGAFQMRCLTAEGRERILKKVGKLAVNTEHSDIDCDEAA